VRLERKGREESAFLSFSALTNQKAFRTIRTKSTKHHMFNKGIQLLLLLRQHPEKGFIAIIVVMIRRMKVIISVALSCLLLQAVHASEATIPSTRGGATSISKYIGDENVETPSSFSFRNSNLDASTKIADDSETSSIQSRNRPSTASRMIRKTKSRKISSPQNIDSTQVEPEALKLAIPSTNTALIINAIDESTEDKVESFIEPMCRPDTGRFALFPIRNHRMWEMYKKHVASFWTVNTSENAQCLTLKDHIVSQHPNEYYLYIIG
jgi:hypothetical protein